MRLLMILVVLVLALAGASCGGDDETAGDTDTVVTETTDTDGDGTSEISSEDCAALIAASSSLSAAFAAAGGIDPDTDEATALFDEWADNAPEEIRDDLEVLAEAYATYVTALDGVDFVAGETPSAETLAELQAAIASIDQAEVQAASEELSTWSSANC